MVGKAVLGGQWSVGGGRGAGAGTGRADSQRSPDPRTLNTENWKLKTDFDAIIVGAGPAGCAAAYDLGRAGRSVLLVDRRAFPRVKPCAGGLTVKTLRALRYDVGPVVRQVCTGVVVGVRSGPWRGLELHRPIVAMTVRAEFDAYCLGKTREAGAEFRVVRRIHEVREEEDGVVLETTDGELRARFVVGADGANSRVRRLVPALGDVTRGFAIETDVRVGGELPPLTFDFGVARHGYAWLFPKGDHVNVGLYTADPDERITREALADYARRRLGTDELGDVVGHHIGLDGWDRPRRTRRIFLAGDAAGLVDALLGEGIYAAVRSGQAAAAAIEAALGGGADPRPVYDRAMRPLLAEARWIRRFATLCHANLDIAWRLVTTPRIGLGALSGYALGHTMRGTFLRLPVLALRQRPRPRHAAAGE